MALSKNDLCVFVATYNRPDLVLVQLRSILAQTQCPDVVTVLDNGGLPETKAAVESFSSQGVRYVDTSLRGRLGNVKTAQNLASGEFVAVFHDDDAVEPHYFESVLSVLRCNADKDLRLITANYRYQNVEAFSFPSQKFHTRGLIMDRSNYADFLLNAYSGFPFSFYSVEFFKKLDFDDIWNKYEKWCDIPIQLSVVGAGNAVFLEYPFGVYGCHSNQDSADSQNLPDVRAWANLEAVYVDALGDDLQTVTGWTNIIWNRRRLKTGYKRRGKKTISMDEYMRYAAAIGAVNSHSFLSWLLSRRFIQKVYSKWRTSRFMRSAKELGGDYAK